MYLLMKSVHTEWNFCCTI